MRKFRDQSGQGMTEYIIIVALIAIAAIAAFTYFGNTVRQHTDAMTKELAGQSGKDAIGKVKEQGDKAGSDSNVTRKTLKDYTNATNSE